MGKVTSKLQLTVPKTIAAQFGIRPGDDLQWFPAGEAIRIVPGGKQKADSTPRLEDRLEMFDKATLRQRRREAGLSRGGPLSRRTPNRGWKREDLYDRGIPR
jgi:bifunctional DNA-binding transcriptional regulator/antitoxin component of YhaV-PrlF toxin-antitoxin module